MSGSHISTSTATRRVWVVFGVVFCAFFGLAFYEKWNGRVALSWEEFFGSFLVTLITALVIAVGTIRQWGDLLAVAAGMATAVGLMTIWFLLEKAFH